MLHVIQAVMWGVAEAPRIYINQENARQAYLDCAKERWGQRYAAYCEHHGLNGDSFDSAQAFVNAIDVSEKSTLNYWGLTAEGSDPGSAQPGNRPEVNKLQQVAGKVDLIKDGLVRLLDEVALLAEQCLPETTASAEACGDRPQETEADQKSEGSSESYATREWQEFAATIKRHFCGDKNQSELLTRDGWRQDIYSQLTSLDYWDWVADRVRAYRELAQDNGFVVYPEPGLLGSFRYANREGMTSEECFRSEWEAWCAAGMYLKAGADKA